MRGRSVAQGIAVGLTGIIASLDFRQEHPHSSVGIRHQLPTRAHTDMAPPSTDVLRGTLDLLILKTLTLEPMHGWGISQRIEQLSRGLLDVNQGSLYPALQRLEQKGW